MSNPLNTAAQKILKRVIKFRALVPVNSDGPKSMHYFDLSKIDDCNRLSYADYDANALMQFTGIKDRKSFDKDGSIELYEGDIVDAWVSRYPDSKTRGVIIYNSHAQAFQLLYENCFDGTASEFLHRYHFFEKVGHIFETVNSES